MDSLESQLGRQEARNTARISREDINLEVAMWFQNKLSHVMAPKEIHSYLSHDDPQTDLEIAYANKWMNKYAHPEGTYNGFQSFCNSPSVEYEVKERLLKNTYTENDLQIAKQFIEAEEGPLFDNDAEIDKFIKQYIH